MSKKSKEKIAGAFIILLGEHDFHEITISEICAWGKIARRTFYNNFSSKEEIISTMCQWVIEESTNTPFDSSSTQNGEIWFEQMLCTFFQVNKNHHAFFQILFEQNLYPMYTEQLHKHIGCSQFFLGKQLAHVPPHLQPYIIPSYIASILSCYKVWWERDYEESPAELAKLFVQMIYASDY